MRIYIIGGSGSGKTTLAKKLSTKHNIPHFDLDDVKWDNSNGRHYIKSRDYDGRVQIIADILKSNSNWIFEGVYFKDWMDAILEYADEVIILQTPRWLRQYRCLKREIKQYRPSKTSLRSLWGLFCWNHNWDLEHMPKVLEKIKRVKIKHRFVNGY